MHTRDEDHAERDEVADNVHQSDAEESRTENFSILVHQLRSSLATVRLAHQILLADEDGSLTDRQRNILHQAQLRTKRMLYLTEDLRHHENGAPSVLDIEKEPGHLEEMLDTTLDEFQVRFLDKDLQLTKNYAQGSKTVPFDREKLQDAIRNIIDNAVKYTPTGGEITVVTSYPGETASITVSDTGMGVPKEKAHTLFQKFVRMDNARHVDRTGMGLGLYIARRVVEEHGGTVHYEPVEPHGSAFTITIPTAL